MAVRCSSEQGGGKKEKLPRRTAGGELFVLQAYKSSCIDMVISLDSCPFEVSITRRPLIYLALRRGP